MKTIIIILIYFFPLFFFSCKTEEIILHGEISGLVTDALTDEPISGALVKLNPSEEKTITGTDGSYVLNNQIPGGYEIQVSKTGYETNSSIIELVPAKTMELNLKLTGIPVIDISDTYLDFGLDSTSLTLTLSNNGRGKLLYVISADHDWISVSPSSGELIDELDTITVTINKTGLTKNIYDNAIKVFSIGGQEIVQNSISIYLNGFMDLRDLKYYKAVKVETQTWMAENLNIGVSLDLNQEQPGSGDIKKYCYDCNIYGGLYTWYATMQNGSSDTAMIGTHQGICPVGWHVPTYKEWQKLIDYLGDNAAGKLKETGTEHWIPPNSGSTNETGFSALPGGALLGNYEWNPSSGSIFVNRHFTDQGKSGSFWTAETFYDVINATINARVIQIRPEGLISNFWDAHFGSAVRCVKDPLK